MREIIAKINKGIPEVEKPKRTPSLKEKLIWTAVTLLIYFFLTEVPLYGIPRGGLD
ncbi:MAG: preprotein translocase subunit SecY, partial [Candidatus Korarchaeota archaeon]|nr:preprotein translocase subunit SecY [Candidatus Korarchaeota archaeon]